MKKIHLKQYISQPDKLKQLKQPKFISPMLATLTHEYFSKENWIYERKFDGERCIIVKKGKVVNLYFYALLLGYYDNKKLCYAGKVGTGFDDLLRHELYQKLVKIRIKNNPCNQDLNIEAEWVRPKIIAEIAFTEWTRSNKLRHPRFKGLRDDKSAKKVVKEA